jgi:iron uptake system component EfeO
VGTGAHPKLFSLVLLGAAVLAAAGCGSSTRQTPGRGAGSALAPVVSIQVDRHGCTASTASLHAGPTTFAIHVRDGNTVTEVELVKRPIILAELENLATTHADRSFSLDLPPGGVTLSCPGGARVRTELAVTGSAPAPADRKAAAAIARYRAWVEGQSRQLVDATLAFTQALDAGDLALARARYPRARVFYERVEPIAESFSTLDREIDSRAGDVPSAQWTGFHPIEQRLWADGTTAGTAALSRRLVANVSAVNSVATRLTLTPPQIANGAVTLLDEVAASKITGEEERYSHIDLVDFAANLAGAQEAFEAVRPLLPASQAQLGQTIQQRFGDVHRALDRYRSGGTYVRYGALGRPDTLKLSQVIDALAEPLSRVSALVLRAG